MLSSVLAVMHYLTSLATRLHGDLYVITLSLNSTYCSTRRNLPNTNGRDGKTLNEVTIVHPHPRPES